VFDSNTSSSSSAVSSVGSELGKNLSHWPTFAFTDNDAAESSSLASASAAAAEIAALEQLCLHAQDAKTLPLMMNTLFQRVHNCWLASANGGE